MTKELPSPGLSGYGAPAGKTDPLSGGSGSSPGELESVKTVEEIREEIVKKASENEAFRAELLADPKDALEKELGGHHSRRVQDRRARRQHHEHQPGVAAGRVERGGPERRRGRNTNVARIRQRLEQLEPELLMRYTEKVP